MGKSLFTTIETEGNDFEVTHDGQTLSFVLPEWFLKLNGKLEDADAIMEWAKDHEISLAFCHRAIAQMIIDFRAAARPADKKGEVQRMEFDSAQDRITNLVFSATKRPGSTGKAKVKADTERKTIVSTCKAMIMAGLEDQMIKTTLESQFDKRNVSLALNDAHMELDSED